jgi:NAD(P)H-quinone oxidoreductase subunit 4L
MTAGLSLFLIASAILFATGCFALLAKRSAVIMLIGTQLMLTAGAIAFTAFARFGLGAGHRNNGPAVALFASATGLCELAVGLAMAAVIYREHRTFLSDEYESVAG